MTLHISTATVMLLTLGVLLLVAAASIGLRLVISRVREQRHQPKDPDYLPPEQREALALPPGARWREEPKPFSITLGQLEAVTEGLRQIPPLPRAALQIMQELNAAGSSATSVARILSQEPVLTASLLRIANSAATGVRKEIKTVSEAVTLLGFSMTKTVVLRFKLAELLSSNLRPSGYDAEKLWAHAVAVAQVGEELARRIPGAEPDLALTVGLLHDIGKLAINTQFADRVHRLWESNDLPLLERERQLFGADHAELGAFLARKWDLPGELVEMIRQHHQLDSAAPLRTAAARTLQAVRFGNAIVNFRFIYCEQMELDVVGEAELHDLQLPSFEQLLSDARLNDIIVRSLATCGASILPLPRSAIAA